MGSYLFGFDIGCRDFRKFFKDDISISCEFLWGNKFKMLWGKG